MKRDSSGGSDIKTILSDQNNRSKGSKEVRAPWQQENLIATTDLAL
jgi:hypothetical protein